MSVFIKIANVTGRQTALFVTYFIMINLPREHELKEEYSFKDDILPVGGSAPKVQSTIVALIGGFTPRRCGIATEFGP